MTRTTRTITTFVCDRCKKQQEAEKLDLEGCLSMTGQGLMSGAPFIFGKYTAELCADCADQLVEFMEAGK